MSITIETRGRRHYLIGNTYPIKGAIRAAGCKWDPEAGAWWTGKRETAEELVAGVASGKVEAVASYTKLDDGSWGVRVPGKVEPGTTVTVATKGGARKTETVTAVMRVDGEQTICAVAPREKAPRESKPRQPSKVGTEGAYSSSFDGSKHNRDPNRQVGETCWLKHLDQRIAVVVVGYERARWIPGDVLEDFGDYSHGGYGAWLGTIYYRAATREEFETLQAKSPREDGVCVEVSE